MENNDNSEVIETVETNEGFVPEMKTPEQEIQEARNRVAAKLEGVQIDLLKLIKSAESLYPDYKISNSLSMRIANGKIVENYSLFLAALRDQEAVIQTLAKKETQVNE